MAPYVADADGDRAAALALYCWSSRTVAASFEVLGHLEVLVRNALDAVLREHFSEAERGIPWFVLPINENVSAAVETTRGRLREQNREYRDQIVAGLSFGFWSGLLGPKYEQLWRECLHRAFPHSTGRRKQVMIALEGVRKFRNRLAHHDSILNVDVPFEVRRIVEVAGFIHPQAADWLTSLSRAMAVYAERPVAPLDTVVVAARAGWPLYHRNDRKIAAVIETSREFGWTEGVYQVFLLTRPGDAEHRTLPGPIPHQSTGRGGAFTQRQRYVSLHGLETARSTTDL